MNNLPSRPYVPPGRRLLAGATSLNPPALAPKARPWLSSRLPSGAESPESTEIFVDNLPPETTLPGLRLFFGRFGRIARLNLPRDRRDDSLCRGFAFVRFMAACDAARATAASDRAPFGHALLSVKPAGAHTAAVAAAPRAATHFRVGGNGGGGDAAPTKRGGKTSRQGGAKSKGKGHQATKAALLQAACEATADPSGMHDIAKDSGGAADNMQAYAIVTRALGGATFRLRCCDGLDRIGKLRGALKHGRRRVRLRVGDHVLVALREFGTGDRADIVRRYDPKEVTALRRAGELSTLLDHGAATADADAGADLDTIVFGEDLDESDSEEVDACDDAGFLWADPAAGAASAPPTSSMAKPPSVGPSGGMGDGGVALADGDSWTTDDDDDDDDDNHDGLEGAATITNLTGPIDLFEDAGETLAVTRVGPNTETPTAETQDVVEVRWVPRGARKGDTVVSGLAFEHCQSLTAVFRKMLGCPVTAKKAPTARDRCKVNGPILVLAGPHVYVVEDLLRETGSRKIVIFTYGMPGER